MAFLNATPTRVVKQFDMNSAVNTLIVGYDIHDDGLEENKYIEIAITGPVLRGILLSPNVPQAVTGFVQPLIRDAYNAWQAEILNRVPPSENLVGPQVATYAEVVNTIPEQAQAKAHAGPHI